MADESDLLTRSLAVAGFVISSLTFVWTLIRDSQDRAEVVLTAMIGQIAPGSDPTAYLAVTITNVGRRPVFIKGWGGAYKQPVDGRDHFFIVPKSLPRMLQEAEFVVEYTPDIHMLNDNVKSMMAWDSSGKEWRLSPKRLKSVIESAKKALARRVSGKPDSLDPGEDY